MLKLVETETVEIKQEQSSVEDWKNEAQKLELQGKKEQADEIRKTILGVQKPDWEPITPKNIKQLKKEALDPENYNKKAKDLLFSYSLLYNDMETCEKLAQLKYKKAENPEKEIGSINRKFYQEYTSTNTKAIERNIQKYGLEYRDKFNLTPLLAAIQAENPKALEYLLNLGANTDVLDNIGRNPFRLLINILYNANYVKSNYETIITKTLTNNIKVKIDNKLVKIPNRKMEYFVLNYFMTLQSKIAKTQRTKFENRGIKAREICEAIVDYPSSLLPDYRKKKTYVSSILSKNEIDGNSPYNLKLFKRIERGIYVLNKDISVLFNDKWQAIYDFSKLDKQFIVTNEERNQILFDDAYRLLSEYFEENQYGFSSEEVEIIENCLERYNKKRNFNVIQAYNEEKDKLRQKREERYAKERAERKQKTDEKKIKKKILKERDEEKKLLFEKNKKDGDDKQLSLF